MLTRSDLHHYQNNAVDFIKLRKRCMLLLEMGLGKTTSALTAATDMLDGCAVRRVLVIAPLLVANSVWQQECAKWEHLTHLKVSVCTGAERKRISALQRTADVYTINRENVPWLVKHYGSKWPFDAVIVDESSSFKSNSAQRWKALKKILPSTEYMVLLTGTPSPNSLLDLWPQMYLVDFGERLGRTMTGYKQRFFEQDYMGYRWTIKEGAAEQIHKLVADVCLSMSAEDYLELPERIVLTEFVDLPPAVQSSYSDFESQLLATLPSGDEIEAINAAVLANKLLQWCNGATYTDANGTWAQIHDAKLDALADIVEANDEPMLVAYNYKSDLARLQKRFPQAVHLSRDQQVIDDWNKGKIPMLLAHPASAGHGLNLQEGGALCVWFGLNWSLELYQQFNARLHRQGQTKPVRIVHIVARNCIDERVLQVLSSKDATQRDLLKALSINLQRIKQ
jgi:SNF2 family DNA or RNA helicase